MSYMDHVYCKNISHVSFFLKFFLSTHLLSLYYLSIYHTYPYFFIFYSLTERPKELVHRRNILFHSTVTYIGSGSGFLQL